jgi:hypothetical protein
MEELKEEKKINSYGYNCVKKIVKIQKKKNIKDFIDNVK